MRKIMAALREREALKKKADAQNNGIPPVIKSVHAIILETLKDEVFKPIMAHKNAKDVLEMLPLIGERIESHLHILLNFSEDVIASWIPHLTTVLIPALCSNFGNIVIDLEVEENDENGEAVHRNITCDICNMSPITGARFKCCVCSDFDLCSKCEASDKHNAKHPMIKFRRVQRHCAKPPFHGFREMMKFFVGGHRGMGQHHHRRPFFHAMHQMFGGGHGGKEHHGRGHHHGRGKGHHGRGRHCHGPFGRRHHNHGGNQGQSHGGEWWKHHPSHGEGPWFQPPPQENEENNVKDEVVPVSKLKAVFVRDVTLPDQSYYPLDTVLTKTWQIRNNGEHAWGDDIELVFFKGNRSLTLEAKYPCINAKAGQSVDVSAAIKTPNKPGRFVAYYRLQRGNEWFGPRLWVDIYVVAEANEVPKQDKFEKVQMKLEKRAAKLESKQLKLESKLISAQCKISSESNSSSGDDGSVEKSILRKERLEKTKSKIENKLLKIQERMSAVQQKQVKIAAVQIEKEDQKKEKEQKKEAKELKKVVKKILKEEKKRIKKEKIEQKAEEVAPQKEGQLQKVEEDTMMCMCGAPLARTTPFFAYNSMQVSVACDLCSKRCSRHMTIYHCPLNKDSDMHPKGYDVCSACMDLQIKQFAQPKKEGLKKNKNVYPVLSEKKISVKVKPLESNLVKSPSSVSSESSFAILNDDQLIKNVVSEAKDLPPFQYASQLKEIQEMGFVDKDEQIRTLLVQHKGQIQGVLTALLQL
jgi:hypothetical protein